MVLISKQYKYVALGIACLVALGYLFVSGMTDGGMVYYLTLEEFQGSKTPKMGAGVKLVGNVKAGSMEGSTVDGDFRFIMTDGELELRVHYRGQVPDAMDDDVEVVVEGIYRDRPEFEAATLLAKCPSKYEAEAEAAEIADGSGGAL